MPNAIRTMAGSDPEVLRDASQDRPAAARELRVTDDPRRAYLGAMA